MTCLVLFVAYTMLINIFWTYVININKALDNKAYKITKSRFSNSLKNDSANFYKLHDDNETVDGDAESQTNKLGARLINTRETGYFDNQEMTDDSGDDSELDYDSEDEDLTKEDKQLRREILRNFMANTKNNMQSTGKYTNMRMTLPGEDSSKISNRESTPVETEQSEVEGGIASEKINSENRTEKNDIKVSSRIRRTSSINDS